MANNKNGFWLPDSFSLQELVAPDIISLGARILTKEVCEGLDAFRMAVNKPLFINTYSIDAGTRQQARLGLYTESGVRSLETKTGAKYSLHKFGRAFDIKCLELSSAELQSIFLKAWKTVTALQVFTETESIEFTPTWLHLGANNLTGLTQPRVIKP